MRLFFACLGMALSPGWAPAHQDAYSTPAYLDEEIEDTRVGGDEALVDLRVSVHRWPDCYSNKTAIRDIFRIENVTDKSDHEKALALWKWFRVLVSATGGGYVYERGTDGLERIVQTPHKIFTVYGHHQCDGMSWAYVPLWRAAGYIAFDECHHGHTIASLRYKDHDGVQRFHDFDPQRRYYYWDEAKGIVGTWSLPVTRGLVHRHLTAPRTAHTLRTSLRDGETLTRLWDGGGYAIPPNRHEGFAGSSHKYFAFEPGRKDGVYAVAGEERQEFAADTSPNGYAAALCEDSANTACSAHGRVRLHARAKGQRAAFVYRFPSPFVCVEAYAEAVLSKDRDEDLCRLLLSADGGRTWEPFCELENKGTLRIKLPIGNAARAQGKPHVFSAYAFLLKAECESARHPERTGMDELRVTVHRELNKRTLPNLRPGRNVWRLDAERIAPGRLLEVALCYAVGGEERTVVKRTRTFPFYFEVDTGPVEEPVYDNYDQHFNDGPLQMRSLAMRLVPASQAEDASLPAAEGAAAFAQADPHPADLNRTRKVRQGETDPMQTSGFFPQRTEVRTDLERMAELIAKMKSGNDPEHWKAAEDLGAYPQAIDALLEIFPDANIDMTFHICKALAQLKDPKALDPLLKKWELAPEEAPGTRYIPDVLAAIGDRRAVAPLVAKLPHVRFDFRFHIAYALGKLGGPEAKAALEDLAQRDPCPAIRELAAEQLR